MSSSVPRLASQSLSASVPSNLSELPVKPETWIPRTLASLSPHHSFQPEPRQQRPDADVVAESVATSCVLAEQTGRSGLALLVASSPSHELDRMQQPQPLLELGGVSLVSHALWQLNAASLATVVVVVGLHGDEVEKQLSAYIETEKVVFEGLRLKFVNLGIGWRGGRVASIVAAEKKLRELVNDSESFVVVGSDHIFDVSLLQRAASADLSATGDEACVLVETDIEGMVGLPPSTVFCALRPLHGADRIYKIGADLETYSGVEAGLMVFTLATIQKLIDMVKTAGDAGKLRVSSLLSDIAERGSLRMMKTDGNTWFSMETEQSAEYTSQGLRAVGQEYVLADGRKAHLVGLPRKISSTSPADGGEWAEFSVEKWRSAVYTAKSFFQELFIDTKDFVGDLCDKLGGASESGPLLVEVGCGTGEALLPLFERAAFVCGMDFNPKFVEFCEQNVPAHHRDRVKHLVGDAQELDSLLTSELPESWYNESRPKVVICVGNTVGIMPPAVRKNVYKQMKQMAGRDGYMVIVYWNGNKFGEAVQHFYHKNPQLCGPFTGECIDLDTRTLTTPSGYCTHWTGPEEARAIFENEIGAEIVLLEEKGKGVLVAGRMRSSEAEAAVGA